MEKEIEADLRDLNLQLMEFRATIEGQIRGLFMMMRGVEGKILDEVVVACNGGGGSKIETVEASGQPKFEEARGSSNGVGGGITEAARKRHGLEMGHTSRSESNQQRCGKTSYEGKRFRWTDREESLSRGGGWTSGGIEISGSCCGTSTISALIIEHTVSDWTKYAYRVGPFRLSTPPTLLELKLAEYIFDNSVDERECIVSVRNQRLSRAAVMTMKPGSNVDIEVISMFVEKMTECMRQQNRCDGLKLFVPCSFSEAVLCGCCDMLTFVHEKRIKELYVYDFERCDQIMIPMSDGELKKWYLLVVCVKRGTAQVWDSSIEEEAIGRRLRQCRAVLEQHAVFQDLIPQLMGKAQLLHQATPFKVAEKMNFNPLS